MARRRWSSAFARLWRRLGGDDGPGRPAPPIGEMFHPVALLALIVLVVNDRVLKGSAAPGWLTGKLSDVAGLIAFPLVVTAAADSLAWAGARLGLAVDFTLRRWKLAGSIAFTAALFAAIKLWPAASRTVAGALAWIFGHTAIVLDPTDLLALPALAVAWWIGRGELRRIPLGRVEYLTRRHRRGAPIDHGFADAIACGAAPAQVAALARALTAHLEGGPAPPVTAALAALREPDQL